LMSKTLILFAISNLDKVEKVWLKIILKRYSFLDRGLQ
jgi:hypothetical protein